MILNVPNQITLLRLVLSIVFFVLVSFDGRRPLDWAETVFVIACVTDYLDGYVARRWNLMTALGRVADPFVDKVIICGGFALLANRSEFVQPWMVVLLISREFLVSSIRGYAESEGVSFGAEMAGKVKAVVQMFALGFVIYYKAHGDLPFLPVEMSRWVTGAAVYTALALTVTSAVTYILKAKRLFAQGA